MLFNQKGHAVSVPKEMNTRTHAHVFESLREVHTPSQKGHAKMFKMETRARFKQ